MVTNIDPFVDSGKVAIEVVDTKEVWAYNDVIELARLYADKMAASDSDTFYFVGGNDVNGLVYMYGAVLAGKTIIPVPDFASEMIVPMLSAVFGVSVDARSLPAAPVSAHPGGGHVIAFTSGTTGRPKAYSHSPNMFELPNDTNAPVEITSDCRIYCTAPLTAAPASYTIALSEGATVGLSSTVLTDPYDIVSAYNEFGGDTLFTTPSLLEKIIDGPGIDSLTGLKRVITSSIPASRSVISKIRKYDIPVYDVYISTETGPIAYRNMTVDDEFTLYPGLGFASSDGVLIKNGHYKAAKGIFTPRGIVPMPDPVINGDYVDLYNGKIHSLSRSPMRVKVSGFSVDLSVIEEEAVLAGAETASVTSESDAPSDIVTLRFTGEIDVKEMRDMLAKRLPWYYVPKVIERD